MSYQKCPCCNGTGKEHNSNFNETSSVYTVCKGHKIISELTGLPPGEVKKELKTNFADIYRELNINTKEIEDYFKYGKPISGTLCNKNQGVCEQPLSGYSAWVRHYKGAPSPLDPKYKK